MVAEEQRRRCPPPATLESVVYRNPLELTLQDGVTVGGLLFGAGAIPRLLEVLKDYTAPGRRERAARADEAEAAAQIRGAQASEAELRAQLLRTLADAEPGQGPSTEALIEAIGDDPATLRLLARIGDLDPTAEPLSDEG
jgi:hypothetical protein